MRSQIGFEQMTVSGEQKSSPLNMKYERRSTYMLASVSVRNETVSNYNMF